jgi:large repetitive protein
MGRYCRFLSYFAGMIALLSLAACAGADGTGMENNPAALPQLATAWPSGLPKDGVQPWEKLDAAGHIAAAGRSPSAAGAGGVFVPVAERAYESPAGVTDNLGTARLESGVPGAKNLSYAMYRLPLGALKPGVVSIDANPLPRTDGKLGQYYVGLSDYTKGAWEWRGPFNVNHVVLETAAQARAGKAYASSLGLMYICLVAYDGARFDAIGIEVLPLSTPDLTAPASPAGFAAEPRKGAVYLSWTPAADPDLAGYRLYFSPRAFTDPSQAGVKQLPYLLDRPEYLFPAANFLLHFRVCAADKNGNASGLSAELFPTPLPGAPPAMTLSSSAPGARPGEMLSLTATGCSSYDWDANGDGSFELLGDTGGQAPAETGQLGIVRPVVRGWDAAGTGEALLGASLLIDANSRPSASATARPQTGQAPLKVSFRGTAEDADNPPEQLVYAWDFDGDGIYEPNTNILVPPQYEYTKAGIYNAKFRVMDPMGAWDVDTVTILVNAAENQPPNARLISPKPYGDAPSTISFDASASNDPDGTIAKYEWDFDGDGLFDVYGLSPMTSHEYSEPGIYKVRVRVEDDRGAHGSAVLSVVVNETDLGAGVWAMSGRDRRRSGRSAFTGPATNTLKWKFRVPGIYLDPIFDAVAGADGSVYVANERGAVRALNPDGSYKWLYCTEGDRVTTPGVGPDGTVYVGSNDGKMYAIDPDGSLKWTFNAGGIVRTPAIKADGTLYFGTLNKLYALNPDGSQRWVYSFTSAITKTPALAADGTIYIGVAYQLYAFNSTGSLQWSSSLLNEVYTSPAVGLDGTIYVGYRFAGIYAFSSSGAFKWQHSTGDIMSTPVIGIDGSVLFESAGTLYALNPDSSDKWSYAMGRYESISRPAVATDGTIYVGSENGRLFAINPDGSFKWADPNGNTGTSSPAIGIDGSVYIVSNSTTVYAYQSDGSVKWQYIPKCGVNSSPAIGMDGTVYIGGSQAFIAINPDGSLKWSYPTSYDIYSSPAIGSDGSIYVEVGKDLCAFNPNGSLKWSYPVMTTLPLHNLFRSPIIGSDDTVYIASPEQKLYAINPSGSLKWCISLYNTLRSDPTIGAGSTVYVLDQSNRLYSISSSGTINWSFLVDPNLFSAPVIGPDGSLYIGGHNLLCSIALNGTVKWSCNPGDGDTVRSVPVVRSDNKIVISSISGKVIVLNPDGSLYSTYSSDERGNCAISLGGDGTVYMTSEDERLYAIDPAGSTKWSYRTGYGMKIAPVIGADGTIYAVSDDGYLYAIGPGAG